MSKSWQLVLFLMIVGSALTGQQRFFFNEFSQREGLSNNSINDIVQDSTGFLWIATDDGLNRFDGHRFKVFRSSQFDQNSLPGNSVLTLYVDPSGNLWCGGRDWSCLVVLEMGTMQFRKIPLSGDGHTFEIRDLCMDDRQNMWIGTSSDIFLYDSKKSAILNIDSIQDIKNKPVGKSVYPANVFAPDPKGKGLWMVTNEGMNFLDYQTHEFRHSGNNPDSISLFSRKPSSRSLVVDKDGNVWSGERRKGVQWWWTGYNPDTNEFFFATDSVPLDKSIQLNSFASLQCSPDNVLWLGNNARMPLLFDVKTRKFDQSLANVYPGALTNQTIRATCFDRDGNTWVGTEQGLFVALKTYSNVEIHWLGDMAEFRKPRIKSLYCPNAETVLLAADTVVFYLSRVTGEISAYPIKIGEKVINEDTRFISRKSEHEAWVASFFGLYSLDLRSKKFTDELQNLPEEWRPQLKVNSQIFNVFTDNDGYTHICTGNGFYTFNHEKQFYVFQRNHPVLGKGLRIFDHSPRSGSGEWYADAKTGDILFSNSPSDTLNYWPYNSRLQITAYCVHDDHDGNLWIGSTSEGIARSTVSGDSLRYYSIVDGLHSNCIYKILEDHEGRIYAITSNGVARYNTSADRFERIFSEYTLSSYSHRDVGSIGPDGHIWSFAENIFYSLDPSSVLYSFNEKKVVITSLEVMDGELGPGQFELLNSLASDQNSLSFEFSVLNFNPNISVKYEYQVEELNAGWINTEGETRVVFTGLAPGKYIFRVRSDGGTGIFSKSFTEIPFHILPPWYATLWFRMLSAIVIILLVVVGARWYIKSRIRKKEIEFEKIRLVEEERLRISRDMHDDLGSGLSSIRLMSENAIKRPDEAKLREISGVAGELVDRMRQIIWALNEEQNTVEDLLFYIVSYSREYARRNNLSVSVGEMVNSPRHLSSGQRRNIFLIIKELLHNVVKHSGATVVELEFVVSDTSLTITLADNGYGISVDGENRFGNGLKNMKKRTKDLGAEITFTNKNGLRVELIIPLATNKS